MGQAQSYSSHSWAQPCCPHFGTLCNNADVPCTGCLEVSSKHYPAIFLDKTPPDIAGYNAVVTKLQKSKNPEVWEQWDWVWHFSAYGLLILNIIFVYNSDPRIINFSFFLVLSALLGLWYIPFVNISTLRIWDNPKRGALYLVPGWAIWAGLISLTTQFAFVDRDILSIGI